MKRMPFIYKFIYVDICIVDRKTKYLPIDMNIYLSTLMEYLLSNQS